MIFKSDKILVILDLDETLIHATSKPQNEEWDFEVFNYKVYKRPYLEQFLEELKKNFYVAIWSSASDDYVNAIVKMIFPPNYNLEFIWGRSRCTYKPNIAEIETSGYFDYYKHFNYIKRLKKIKGKYPFRKERILIIDDTPQNVFIIMEMLFILMNSVEIKMMQS